MPVTIKIIFIYIEVSFTKGFTGRMGNVGVRGCISVSNDRCYEVIVLILSLHWYSSYKTLLSRILIKSICYLDF